MKHFLSIEAIGHNLSNELISVPPRWWVAEIKGLHPNGKLVMTFLRPSFDYSKANSTGSRGIHANYILQEGVVYYVAEPKTWKSTDKYFLLFSSQGEQKMKYADVKSYVSREAYPPREEVTEDKPVAPEGSQTKKIQLSIDVFTAAKERISRIFDDFPKIYISFSGGKDSTVMLHLVMEEAIKRKRKVAVLLVDLEAQYSATITHSIDCFEQYKDHIERYWLSIPMTLRNALSTYDPRWTCWDKKAEKIWVRKPPDFAITDPWLFDFYNENMEFEEFVEKFGEWYGRGKLTACFVGIRADESLNRFRTLIQKKTSYYGLPWTTKKSSSTYNIYPIYDWKTDDIWIYHAKTGKTHNNAYDLMHKAGVGIHQMRLCQPYGDDQRKGLWLYHILEPETWPKIIARVNGANSGALYANETGNMLGNRKIIKPEGHTWQSFSMLLLESMPDVSKEHYMNKIAVFLKWYEERGYPNGIPDSSPLKDEASKKVPSWRRIAKTLLKNDWWCKNLSFSQNKSTAYEKYMKVMKNKRKKWKI